MSILTELWANPPATATTVSSGGTTAPAQGTSQSWTMAGGYASFPAANSSASPLTQFHVIDPALPSEIIAVTNVSGATWTVTRGAEGTTPVAHVAGFTVQQVVTAAGLDQLLQGPPSGDGLALGTDQSNSSILSVVSTTTSLTAATMTVPGGEAIPSSVYEIECWGTYTTGASNTILTWTVTWGGVSLGSQPITMPASVTSGRWRFKGSVSISAGPTAAADFRLEIAPSSTASTAVAVYLFGNNTATGVSIATSSALIYELVAAWTTGTNSLYVFGGVAWKRA
jgi:hypothetical protein